MDVLQRILEQKKEEVLVAEEALPKCELESVINSVSPARGFRNALQNAKGLALIAEVKKASPSRGVIREDFDPVQIAKAYQSAGAQCLSILTDEPNFQGSPAYLRSCREATDLPCLRKDFIFDEYQVLESRAWGADAILLIVAMLESRQLRDLHGQAKVLGMDVLVEVHTEEEIRMALEIGADLIGVNNRNLRNLKTDINTSLHLLPMLKGNALAVSESALKSKIDLDRVHAAGAKAVLIGTTFCAAPDIKEKVREVMGW